MKKDDAITHLLSAFPKILFVLQTHEDISDRAEKRKGKFKPGDELTLNFLHFLTLSLIDSLIKSEGKCERTYLKEIFFCKHKGRPDNLFEETVMDRLIAANLIHSERIEGDQQHFIDLTDKGQQLLKTIEKDRRASIETIIDLLEREDPRFYQTMINVITEIAEASWTMTRNSAKTSLNNKKKRSSARKPSTKAKRRRTSSCH